MPIAPKRLAASGAACCTITAGILSAQIGISLIPLPSGELSAGQVRAISGDGNAVVGAVILTGGDHPWIWNALQGTRSLPLFTIGLPAGVSALAFDGSSACGSAFVPRSQGGFVQGAVRWQVEPSLGIQALGEEVQFQDGRRRNFVTAYAMSADGSRFGGYGMCPPVSNWIPILQTPPGDVERPAGCTGSGEVKAMSANGAVVAGRVVVSGQGWRAFRSDATGGLSLLGVLPGTTESDASGISADGNVIVGRAYQPFAAFRWTAFDGMQALPMLPGATSAEAFACNADGSIVVGVSQRPCIWIDGAPYDFEVLVRAVFGDLGGMSQILSVDGVSDDGLCFAGTGIGGGVNARAYRVRLPCLSVLRANSSAGDGARSSNPATCCPGDANGDRVVNFSDLNIVLSDFGQVAPPATLGGDVDFDGDCDFADLNVVLSQFGSSC